MISGMKPICGLVRMGTYKQVGASCINDTEVIRVFSEEQVEKLLNQLHNEIMNLPCPKSPILLTDEHLLLIKTGHKLARHQASELVVGIMAGKEEE